MNRRFEITDDGWERLAPLLPERLMNRRKQFRAATRYDTQSMMRPVRVGSSV